MHVVNINGNTIGLFVRNEDGKRELKIINDFRPYFYVRADEEVPNDNRILKIEEGFTSIFGEKLKKLTVTAPFVVKELRNKFSITYEDDITFSDRFLIDNPNLFDQYRNEKIRFLIIDTEEDSLEEFPKAEEAKLPIISISCYDNFLDKYIIFTWREDLKVNKVRKEKYTVNYFNSEKLMLIKFIQFVRSANPDIILGWNFIRFDMQYLINRMKQLNIDYRQLSQVGMLKFDNEYNRIFINIGGMTALDAQELYEKMQQLVYNWSIFGLESSSLDSVAKNELGEGKAEHENPGKMWRENIEKLIYYNYYDTYLVKKIVEKLDLINLLNELRLVTHSSWDAISTAGRYLDFLILNYCKQKNIVLPSKRKQEKKKYKGAEVLEPTPGLIKNVIEMDMKSLYPSIIMNMNISPETIVDKNYSGEKILVDDTYFSIDREGILPNVIKNIYNQRLKMKRELKEIAKTKGLRSDEYNILNIRQTILKLIINAIYGVFAFEKFRLYSVEVAKSITYLGRKIVFETVKNFVESEGYKVIYADTDSLFIKVSDDLSNEEVKKIAFSLKDKINRSFENFVNSLNKNLHNEYLEIELDKIFESILFIEAKKKYVGIVIYSNDKDMRELQLVGFEMKRRDTPRFAKEILFEVYNKILEFKTKEEVYKLLIEKSKKIRDVPLEDIGITIRLGKNLDEYATNTQHSRAAKYSEKYLNKGFSRLDYVKIFFVKSVPKGFPKTDVIALSDGDTLPKGFVIDYERTLRRLVEMKLDDIFKILGWSFDETRGQKLIKEFV